MKSLENFNKCTSSIVSTITSLGLEIPRTVEHDINLRMIRIIVQYEIKIAFQISKEVRGGITYLKS